MTERSAPGVQAGASSSSPQTGHAPAGRPGLMDVDAREAAVHRSSARTHQPMALEAVLRHVMLLDQVNGSGVRPCISLPVSAGIPRPRVSPESVPSAESPAVADDPGLRQLNHRLNATLDMCLQLDTARLQLQNVISTQRELETVLEMLAARVEAGRGDPAEHRRVTSLLTTRREKVNSAVSEWNRVGRLFTQHTRLLPAQLEAVVDNLGPLPADEMDRLAEACLWTHADLHFSVRQRAHAWAGPRMEKPESLAQAPEGFLAWMSRLEEVRSQAAADFAAAREVYLQSVLNVDREHACLVRARSLRRTAETGFRYGSRSALHFTDAIIEESERLHGLLALQAQRLAAKHRLFALAGLLPRQYGLVDRSCWH